MVWSSWIAPTDAPEEVNFHRHGFFGALTLVPVAAPIGREVIYNTTCIHPFIFSMHNH
jgi:hypothetical protein